MYLKKVILTDIKSINELEITFAAPYAGWHVLLGDNGSGKSTTLKAIALCLLGERQGYTLKQNFKNWIRKEKKEAHCHLDILLDQKQDLSTKKFDPNITCQFQINPKGDLLFNFANNNGEEVDLNPTNATKGWYSAAFGPYRRFGEKDIKQVSSYSDGNLENHITLFDSSYNMNGAIQWLMDLKFEKLSTNTTDSLYDKIIHLINHSDLLPNNVYIEKVDHNGVFFKDGHNANISINELSDGYQSIFSLTMEMIRQLSKRFDISSIIEKQNDKYIINATGIVLIDEIDIHLHPQWQAKIGNWFKHHFPNIQFIVSTHSPIICQSAVGGSIWKIEHAKTNKPSYQIIEQDFKRMVYGSIIDAIGTDSFGETSITRSQQSKQMLDRLAKLNIKAVKGIATSEEIIELKNLRAILPSEKTY